MKLLRLSLLALVVALAALAAPAGAGISDGASHAIAARSDLNRSILQEMNALRVRKGLRPLRMSRPLATAARVHSMSMARQGYFTHESANGREFWRRIKSFYRSSGYAAWRVGENLLWASPDVSAKGALELWLKSPRHREILLKRDWREIGLSAVHAPSAPGTYQGREVTIVTADFGARSR